MAFAEDLLEQARHLARRDPKKPKQASLRRAVSTAYYALFHLLISEASKNWKQASHRHTLGRAFEHGKMKSACEKKRSELNTWFKTGPTPGASFTLARNLPTVADTFIELQQYRQSADYDSVKRWSRTETLSYVDAVAAAFKSWKTICKHPSARDFLFSLLIRDR